jgi:hypothetical protein
VEGTIVLTAPGVVRYEGSAFWADKHAGHRSSS